MPEALKLSTAPAKRQRISFSRIVGALRVYAAEFLRLQARPLHRLASEAELPPPLAWAALRGEGIVRLRFCRHFETQGLSYESGEQLLALWPRLGHNPGLVFELLARAGVFAALSTQFRLPEPTPALAWQLYCGMIDNIERAGHDDLLELLTDRYWRHHFLNQFPANASPSAAPSIAAQRQRLHKALQKHYGLPVEIREHFDTGPAGAVFRVRWRTCPPGREKAEWTDGDTWRGPRLKPVKRQAYEAALARFGDDARCA